MSRPAIYRRVWEHLERASQRTPEHRSSTSSAIKQVLDSDLWLPAGKNLVPSPPILRPVLFCSACPIAVRYRE